MCPNYQFFSAKKEMHCSLSYILLSLYDATRIRKMIDNSNLMNYNIHVLERKCVPIIIFFAPDSQYEFSQ